MALISHRDIIIVGLQPWDTEIGSNCKNIALEFSKHNRVLYVNSPLDRITIMRNKSDLAVKKRKEILKGKLPGIENINNNLLVYYPDIVIESINWIKHRGIFNLLNKINNRKIAKSILKAAKALGLKDFILFNDNDIFRSFYLKEYLEPKLSIYYSRDFLLGVDYWKFHGSHREPKLIAKSDLCVANSLYLKSYCMSYNPHSYYVGQGCELELFQNLDGSLIPEDLQHIQSPIIGYVGALQSIRLDIDLIANIARSMSNCAIVLVGPEDDQFKKSELHRIPNIYFTGSKMPFELPAYINAFDVCINPQKINEVTIGNYPRKIDEYLAVGKPTIATKTESMSVFSEHVFLASSAAEYIQFINQALADDQLSTAKQKKDFAAAHTWEASVSEIYSAILKSLN